MIKYSTYRIIQEININLEYYSGITNVNDLVELRGQLSHEKQLNNQFNFIVDLRDAIFDLHSNVVEDFISYVKSTKDLLWKRKTAILSSTPGQTAFSDLYISESYNMPMKVRSFSYLESVINWLELSSADKTLIENVIIDIKSNIK